MNEAPTRPAEPGRPPEFLEACGVVKDYVIGAGTLPVLKAVDLTVAAADFVAVRGASGAGKSTLLHLLGGLDSPTRGTIRFLGRDLARLAAGDLARFRNHHIGFVFQAYHLIPELSAVENVCLPARLGRVPAKEAAERARQLLDQAGLGQRTRHRPYQLSGGEQQRVAIARALVMGPDLVLADEPTGNLDSRTGEEIMDLLCRLREDHRTALLIATHDARVATRAARVLELADGRMQPTIP